MIPPSLAACGGGGDALSARDTQDMDRLADQLAEGRSLAAAARRCGMSIFRAEALFHQIRYQLGAQAE